MSKKKSKKDNFKPEEIEEIFELEEEVKEEKEDLPVVSYKDEKQSIFELEDLSISPEEKKKENIEEPEPVPFFTLSPGDAESGNYFEENQTNTYEDTNQINIEDNGSEDIPEVEEDIPTVSYSEWNDDLSENEIPHNSSDSEKKVEELVSPNDSSHSSEEEKVEPEDSSPVTNVGTEEGEKAEEIASPEDSQPVAELKKPSLKDKMLGLFKKKEKPPVEEVAVEEVAEVEEEVQPSSEEPDPSPIDTNDVFGEPVPENENSETSPSGTIFLGKKETIENSVPSPDFFDDNENEETKPSELPEPLDEVEGSNETTETEPKKKGKFNNRIVFWIIFGILAIAIAIILVFLPKQNEEGEGGFLSSLFGGEQEEISVDTPATLPIDDGSFQEEDANGPILEETEIEEEKKDKNAPVKDAHTKALEEILSPIFLNFNASLEEVSKTKGVIQVKGTIKKEDLFEINRLVRMAQAESYPYLVDKVYSTNIQLTKGKNLYSYETNKKVIEFIAMLNYEDRHSSQMWWSKTTAYKNGRNLKATMVKDRLYVDYLHPIFAETQKEAEVDSEGNVVDGDGNNLGSSESTPLEPKDYDNFKNYENAEQGLFFEHPKELETTNASLDKDGVKTFSVQNSEYDTAKLPLSFKVEVTDSKLDGTDAENLPKAFAISTDRLESTNSAYSKVVDKQDKTNFAGQKFLVRKYKVPNETQTYYVTHAVSVVGDKVYSFTISHAEQDNVDAEMIYRSSNLGDTAVKKEEPKTDTPVANKKENASTTVPANSSVKTAAVSAPEGCDIRGVKADKKYYMPGSEGYDSVATDIPFCREDDAQKAGYKKA